MASSNTNISPSKQTRIDIWRTEVATLTTAPSPTTPTSTTTTNTTATSSSSSSTYSSPFQKRRRSLWRRLARRITGRDNGCGDDEDAWDQDVRTEMYRAVVDKPRGTTGWDRVVVEEDEEEKEEVALGEESSGHGRGGKLKEKQGRLERAARLLDQGAARNGERPWAWG